MTVEVRALAARCNLRCSYCYQNAERDRDTETVKTDLQAIFERLAALKADAFTVFGGEALLLPLGQLEQLLAKSHSASGRSSIQTNGALIRQRHIELFRRYNTVVGISVDGPGSLNDARSAGSLRQTRRQTENTLKALDLLCQASIPTSVIITLTRHNAIEPALSRLCDWLLELDTAGVRSARLHILEVDSSAAAALSLTIDENIAALERCAVQEKRLTNLRVDIFADMRNMLLGQDQVVTCTWQACDPLATQAVDGVEPDGSLSNCGRVYKDGNVWAKADEHGFERVLALYATPQEYGGCAGCRFFLFCKGQCPGTAIDGDWRNRTMYCEVWKHFFRRIEQELADSGHEPLSLSPQRGVLEGTFLARWARGVDSRIIHARESAACW